MAIEAIQGKVRSEPLNRNFSYVESKAHEAKQIAEEVKNTIYYANVLDYGADPTGDTASADAIQAAIDALSNGGTLMIPKGTYLIDKPLKFDVRGLTIQGEGKSSVLKADSSLTDAILQSLYDERSNVTYLDNVIIEKINFDGQGRNVSGFKATGFTRGCVVRDCYFIDCGHASIEIAGSWSFALERNNIYGSDNTGYGMLLGATSTGTYDNTSMVNQAFIFNNTIRRHRVGIQNDYGYMNMIVGNTVELNNSDIVSISTKALNIQGNYFEQASSRSLYLGGTQNVPENTIISGNFFNASNDAVGEIYIESLERARIFGNHFNKSNNHLYVATGAGARIVDCFLDFPARGRVYNESELDYLTNTIYFNDVKFRYVRTSRLEVAANIGFFGKKEVGQQSVSGSTTEARLNSLISSLQAYGLIRE